MKTIIAHPNFQYLAKELVEKNPGELVEGSVSWEKFPDGSPNMFIHNVKQTIEHKDVTYIADVSTLDDIFSQLSVIRSVVDYYASKVRIIVPYFNCGTMERQSKKGEIVTAKYLADMFGDIPSGRDSKNSLHTFDIHALQERFYFNPHNINTELHTATSLLEVAEDEYLAFPDEGAAKRFKESFPNVSPQRRIICDKVRIEGSDKRVITLKEGNPHNKKIILIDDLIQSGGTLRDAAKMLKEKGAITVKAYCPHMICPNDSHKMLAEVLDELIVTDSIPSVRKRIEGILNIKILPISPLIEKIIIRDT